MFKIPERVKKKLKFRISFPLRRIPSIFAVIMNNEREQKIADGRRAEAFVYLWSVLSRGLPSPEKALAARLSAAVEYAENCRAFSDAADFSAEFGSGEAGAGADTTRFGIPVRLKDVGDRNRTLALHFTFVPKMETLEDALDVLSFADGACFENEQRMVNVVNGDDMLSFISGGVTGAIGAFGRAFGLSWEFLKKLAGCGCLIVGKTLNGRVDDDFDLIIKK